MKVHRIIAIIEVENDNSITSVELTKLSLDKLFLNEVTTNKDLRISVLGKNSFHQPIFKKLK